MGRTRCFHSIKVPDQQGLLSITLLLQGFYSFHSIKVPDQQGRYFRRLLGRRKTYVSIRSKSPTSRDKKKVQQANSIIEFCFHSIKVPDQQGLEQFSILNILNGMFPFDQSPRLAGTIRVKQSDLLSLVSIRSKSPTSRDKVNPSLALGRWMAFPFDQSPRLAGTAG